MNVADNSASNRPRTSGPRAKPRHQPPAIWKSRLEEELQRLPEKHRAPLVLCYLEGKTNEQAAHILGCPVGSMSARLNQARERLRAGLARRGYCAGAAGITAALNTAATHATVPVPLVYNTVRAALWFASEKVAGTAFLSAEAMALARGACRAMFVHKVKIATAALLVMAFLGAGASMLLTGAVPSGPPIHATMRTDPDAADERLPKDVIARMGTTRLRHGDAIYFGAYTSNGNSLVTAGRDGTIRLWDVATGREIRRFAWRNVQPDTKAEVSHDKHLRERAKATARRHRPEQAGDAVPGWHDRCSLSEWRLSACGKRTRGQGSTTRIQTGQQRLVQLAFSADGKRLATVGPAGQAVAFWDVATAKCLRGLQITPPAGYRSDGHVSLDEQDAIVSPGLKYLAYQWREFSGNRRIHVRGADNGPGNASNPRRRVWGAIGLLLLRRRQDADVGGLVPRGWRRVLGGDQRARSYVAWGTGGRERRCNRWFVHGGSAGHRRLAGWPVTGCLPAEPHD